MRNQAARLCQSKLAELQSGVLPMNAQGDTPFDEDPDYHWSLTADQQGTIPNLWTITIKVSRDNSNGDPIENTITQMVIDPSILGNTQDATPVIGTNQSTSGSGSSSSSSGSSGSSGAAAPAPAKAAPAKAAPAAPAPAKAAPAPASSGKAPAGGNMTQRQQSRRPLSRPSRSGARLAPVRDGRRAGFTLLEVLLAMGIGLILLGALYVAVDNQLKNTQAARDIVEQSTLARALLTRMGNDITSTITLSDPARFRTANSASNSSSSTAASSTTGSTSTASTSTTGTSTSGTSTTGTSTTGTGNATVVSIPLGLIGDSATLHLFVSRMPRAVVNIQSSDPLPLPVSDTRRISYWLVGGGDAPGGLAKMEVQPITSDDVMLNIPPGIDNENQYIIADEVRSLTFSYFDGLNWNESWDSTILGADGVTPIGPPCAVKIDIELPGLGGPNAPTKHYTHVVAIGTANGTTPLIPSTTPGMPSTTGTPTPLGGGTSP